MGLAVLILGESGSGKSTSLRNFNSDEIGIFNVAGKPFPFRKKLEKIVNNATYDTIFKSLQKPSLKRYVIDDSQFLMAFEAFDRANETGYSKFTSIAVNFRNLLDCVRYLPDDVIVYFLHHTEDLEGGRVKAKTIGKMLDSQLTIEGLFSIVLLTKADGAEHYFITNSDGTSPAKSPMEMFELKIDNDLKMVDETIRKYYELGGDSK